MDRIKLQLWLRGAWRSLTIWLNTVGGLIIIGLPELQAALPQVAPYIPGNIYKVLAVVLIVLNVLVRLFKTKSAIIDKGV
jgi:biotin transporter BioY